jgi:hypothetical protein
MVISGRMKRTKGKPMKPLQDQGEEVLGLSSRMGHRDNPDFHVGSLLLHLLFLFCDFLFALSLFTIHYSQEGKRGIGGKERGGLEWVIE